jgi:alanine racemase
MSRYVIDKSKLEENIRIVKEKAGVDIIGVVKGNGYGFGIREFTGVLKDNGISTFAVTEVDDIDDVKSVLDGEDILVMRSTAVESEARLIAENGCIATIGSTEAAEVMNRISGELGVTTRCYLKIDTGMGRYGFMPSQVEEAVKCYSCEKLEFIGIYTHFSSAFYNDELTASQLAVFKDTAEQIKKEVGEIGIIHASNSPALFSVKGVALDAVRIGSAFTGRIITNGENPLQRVGMLEAEVVETKTVPAGYSIGYNGIFTTARETKIAIVPIGHYDGFGLAPVRVYNDFRSVLSQAKKFMNNEKLTVNINGKAYDVIGDIGLTHTAVDVTGSDVKAGDTASVDISPLLVNPRIKRVYK